MGKQYRIENTESGVVLGVYEADSESDALDVMARDAGYESQADALRVTGGDVSDLVVTQVDRCIVWSNTLGAYEAASLEAARQLQSKLQPDSTDAVQIHLDKGGPGYAQDRMGDRVG